MAPKADSSETAELVELFKKIGLTQSKAAEAAKSPKSASTLKDIIDTHNLVNKNLDEKQAVLLAALAVQGGKLGDGERDYAVGAILGGKLKTTDQVSGERDWSGLRPHWRCNDLIVLKRRSSISTVIPSLWTRRTSTRALVSVSVQLYKV